MDTNPPLFFLGFANQAQQPLLSLARESDFIRRALLSRLHQFHLRLEHESFITVDRLSRHLIDYKDQITGFHFGGHAEEDQLIFSEIATGGEAIADLISMQQGLQFVFLNGCRTVTTGERMISLGVPIVIATTEKVADEPAAQFASRFYYALANGFEIEQAFNMTESSYFAGTGSTRGFDTRTRREARSPWRLLKREDGSGEKAARWKIPRESYRQIVISDAIQRFNLQAHPPNETLVKQLWMALAPYSAELKFYQNQQKQGKSVDIRRVRREIMDALPAPVGVEIRRLFSAEPENEGNLASFSMERLEQIVKTYDTLVELLAYIMLSQLWDAKMLQPDLIIQEEQLEELRIFFTQAPSNLMTYDFIRLIRAIRIIFDDNEIHYFLEEVYQTKVWLYEKEDFALAYQFMQHQRELLANPQASIDSKEVESYCVQAEEHLGVIFNYLSFCARYKFRTIKNIDLIKFRHRDPQYRLSKVHLDTISAGYVDDHQVFPHFTDDRSVILFKESDNVKEYLNLSPFVIDKNALLGESQSQLCYFNYYSAKEDVIYYKYLRSDDQKFKISSENFGELLEEFHDFISLIFKCAPHEL